MCWMQEKWVEKKSKQLWKGPHFYGKTNGSEYLCALFLVSSGWSLPTVTWGGTNQRRGVGHQGSSMHKGNEVYSIWSEPTGGLLRHNAHQINDSYGRNVSQHCCIWGCIAQTAYDDPCPLSKAPTMGTWMSELDLGRRLLDPMSPIFLLHHMDGRVRVHHLPGVVMAPGCILGG